MNTRRFIAGAVCPACGEMDTIQTYKNNSGLMHRECVDCRFMDTTQEVPILQGSLPQARISREEKALDHHQDIIRIVESTDNTQIV